MFCPEASGAGNLCAAPDKSRLRNEGQIHFQSALSKAALLGGKQSSPGAWDEAQGVPEVLGGGEWEPTVHTAGPGWAVCLLQSDVSLELHRLV